MFLATTAATTYANSNFPLQQQQFLLHSNSNYIFLPPSTNFTTIACLNIPELPLIIIIIGTASFLSTANSSTPSTVQYDIHG
jgi:hypothetical protein